MYATPDELILLDAPDAHAALRDARHSFDAFDGAHAVLRAAFRAVQLDGGEPHVVDVRFERVDDVRAVLPADATILRSVLDADGEYALFARGAGYSIFVQEDERCFVTVSAATPERARSVAELIRANAPAPIPDDDHVAIHTWHRTGNGPRSTRQTIEVPEWAHIARNYPAVTRSAIERLVSIGRPTGSGRLLLWHGPPGTGKTTALRALFRSWSEWCHVQYVADPEAMFGSPDYLYRVIAQDCDCGKARLVVTEDGDEFLRAGARFDAGAALGRLLNLTDGVLGQGSDTYVLLTTNTELDRLHPALLRPGRCLAAVQFGRFTPDEAAEWLGPDHAAPTRPSALADLFEIRGDIERVQSAPRPSTETGIGLYL